MMRRRIFRQPFFLAMVLGWSGVAASPPKNEPLVTGVQSHEAEDLCRVLHTLRGGDPRRPTLIMVLSPRMVYALKEWPRMRETARQAGFAVVSMRDPRLREEEWQAAVQALEQPDAANLAVLEDPHLFRLGVLNHAPTSVVAWKGRVHPWPIYGVMPDGAWRAVLAARLAQLGSCS